MRVGQLVQLGETFSVDFDAENGTALFSAQNEEEVLQVVELLGMHGNVLYTRVYSPEQQVTFDVPAGYLEPNTFVDNEEALHLYEWPLLPIVTAHVEVKCTDRQAVLPVLPEPRLFPFSAIEKLPYYKAEGASVSPAECEDEEWKDFHQPSALQAAPVYTRKRALLEAAMVIAAAALAFLFISNFS